MERNPSVTVLCSTYNSAKWIDGYLQSINNQLLKDFDIIFVDANSNDGSLETIKDFDFREGIDAKIVACDTRIPIYEAWNMAIEMATTPYVINVNTDDRLYPAGLITYINYAQAHPTADILYSSYVVTGDSEHTKLIGLRRSIPHHHSILLQACTCGPFPLLKKSSIVEDGMFDPSFTISGDYEMWLRMSKKGRNLVNVMEPLGTYYENPEGMSTNRESSHWQEHVRQDTEIRRLYK